MIISTTPSSTLILLTKSIDIKNLLFVRVRFLVTIVPRNDKNKKNILGMTKTRKISLERQKKKNVIPNECEGSYSPSLILFRPFKDFNNIHLLFLIYQIHHYQLTLSNIRMSLYIQIHLNCIPNEKLCQKLSNVILRLHDNEI